MRSLRTALLLPLLAGAACADSSRMAMGDANSIIVVADERLWDEVADTLSAALEPRIFAVRPEPTFKLTHVSPTSTQWRDLRRFRQVLAIGRAEDPWVEEVLSRADTTVSPPALVQATRVWARNQLATAVVVPEGDPVGGVREQVGDLAALLDRGYRLWAQQRMYTSGVDTALADTLRRGAGFTVRVPNVYTKRREGENGYLFFNDQAAGTPLVRSLFVTWREAAQGAPTAERALAWRDAIAASIYDWPQESQRDPLQVRPLDAPGAAGLEVRGVWYGTEDPSFPQGGPFITRLVDCPGQDRRYLLDAWLYAPATDKYQYMIQLETLLDSFQCAPA